MNLEQAKEIFDEITELCYETENQKLIDLVEIILPEVIEADDISIIISSAEEVQVNLNEMDILENEEEIVQEMHEKIEKLSE